MIKLLKDGITINVPKTDLNEINRLKTLGYMEEGEKLNQTMSMHEHKMKISEYEMKMKEMQSELDAFRKQMKTK